MQYYVTAVDTAGKKTTFSQFKVVSSFYEDTVLIENMNLC